MEILLREATIEDLDWILVELEKFSSFFDSKIKLYSQDEAPYVVRMLIDNHYFLVSEVDKIPTGFIAGMEHNHAFNPKIKVLTEFFWWVKEEHRQSKSGSYLLNEFIKHGDSFDWVCMSLEHNSPIKPESLLKKGFNYKEQSFIKENV